MACLWSYWIGSLCASIANEHFWRCSALEVEWSGYCIQAHLISLISLCSFAGFSLLSRWRNYESMRNDIVHRHCTLQSLFLTWICYSSTSRLCQDNSLKEMRYITCVIRLTYSAVNKGLGARNARILVNQRDFSIFFTVWKYFAVNKRLLTAQASKKLWENNNDLRLVGVYPTFADWVLAEKMWITTHR